MLFGAKIVVPELAAWLKVTAKSHRTLDFRIEASHCLPDTSCLCALMLCNAKSMVSEPAVCLRLIAKCQGMLDLRIEVMHHLDQAKYVFVFCKRCVNHLVLSF